MLMPLQKTFAPSALLSAFACSAPLDEEVVCYGHSRLIDVSAATRPAAPLLARSTNRSKRYRNMATGDEDTRSVADLLID